MGSLFVNEMVQMAMGMMGMFAVHPRDPKLYSADRDFVFIMSAYDIDPGTYLPKVSEMTDFNMWTWNSRVFPGIDPLPVRLGDHMRVRMGNLSMTNHPIHLHGLHFSVTGTDVAGCRNPRADRRPRSMFSSARSGRSSSSPIILVTGRPFATDSPHDERHGP
jgi:FtsP/CotA-like multicopper oxidase with cupredoxin domain